MKFLFLLHGDAGAEAALPDDGAHAHRRGAHRVRAMLRDLGVYVSGEALDDPRGTAVVVRPARSPP